MTDKLNKAPRGCDWKSNAGLKQTTVIKSPILIFKASALWNDL